jgi:mRNA interferase MazF
MHRGEVWLVNLDPTIGSEIKKTRRCVVINNDAIGILPNKVIVPITEWNNKFARAPWMVKITPDNFNGLDKASAADAFQIRSVSEIRFVRQVGVIANDKLDEIVEAILTVISAV